MDRNTEEPTIKVGRSRKRRVLRALSRISGELTVLSLLVLGGMVFLIHGGFPSIFLIVLAFLVPVELVLLFIAAIRCFRLVAPKPRNPEDDQRGPFYHVLIVLIAVDLVWSLLVSLAPADIKGIFRHVEFPFSAPSMVIADSQGSVYILSSFNHRVQKYDTEGNFQLGWFWSSNYEGPCLAIDADDNIYVYSGNCVRYTTEGRRVGVVEKREGYHAGWWTLEHVGVVDHVPDLREPKPMRYSGTLQPGDVLPSVVGNVLPSRRVGFETADGTRYTIRHLYWLFPVVEVTRDSEHVRWICPNLFSMPLSYMYPGFPLYVFLCVIAWIGEKRRGVRVLSPRQERENRIVLRIAYITFLLANLVGILLAVFR